MSYGSYCNLQWGFKFILCYLINSGYLLIDFFLFLPPLLLVPHLSFFPSQLFSLSSPLLRLLCSSSFLFPFISSPHFFSFFFKPCYSDFPPIFSFFINIFRLSFILSPSQLTRSFLPLSLPLFIYISPPFSSTPLLSLSFPSLCQLPPHFP